MKAFVALGSNIPPRKAHIKRALELLGKGPGVYVKRCSRLYETEPVGMKSSHRFLNGVCEVETTLEPVKFMALLLRIEKELGRDRSKGMDREIDLDLLYYDNKILDVQGLTLPHPRLAERAFVLEPWQEIAPDLVVAPWNKTVSQMYKDLKGKG